MSVIRIPARLALVTAVTLAPAAAGAQQDGAEIGAPDRSQAPPVPPEGARSGTEVELFDFVGGVAGATGEILEAEAAADRALRAGILRVGDLENRAVLGAGGKVVGEIERIVRQDGTVWAVIEPSGFSDSELTVELGRLVVTPDYELRVPDLSGEGREATAAVDLETAEDLPSDMPVAELGG